MLCLSDFVICKKRYYNQSRGVCTSAFEHCRKMKFRTYLLLTQEPKFFMLSWLNDFVICSTSLYILVVGSISKVLNIMLSQLTV